MHYFVATQVTLAIANIPGMVLGYWWSFAAFLVCIIAAVVTYRIGD